MDIHLDMITATETNIRQIIPELDVHPTTYLEYGTVTVVYDTFEPGFDELWRFLGYEHITAKDKMVVDFKTSKNIYDPELVDSDDIIFSGSVSTVFPIYITHTKSGKNNTYFHTTPEKNSFLNKYHDKNLHSVFGKMPEYPQYEASAFNGTYTYTPKYGDRPRPKKQVVFGILKLKPTQNTCRMLIAYNPEVLNEEECVYITKKIIQNSYFK
jgi:hypothetical protein